MLYHYNIIRKTNLITIKLEKFHLKPLYNIEIRTIELNKS